VWLSGVFPEPSLSRKTDGTRRRVSVADLQRFRRLRPRFSSSRYDDLYRRWVKDPDVASLERSENASAPVDCVLRVHLQHSYGNTRERASL